jgi:uncharacterized protein (TIGR00156 family)
MRLATTILLAIGLGLLGASAHAGYVGPQAKADTVQDIIDNARAYDSQDRDVRLRGRITKQLSQDRFEFTDATGTIRVEIDPDDFPLEPIDENTPVEIMGEVEAAYFESPEIEVEVLRVLPPGTVLEQAPAPEAGQ